MNVQGFFSLNRTNDPSSKRAWALACLWCAGLVSGLFVVFGASDSLHSLMLPAIYARVSIVGLLSGLLLPLLLSYIFFRLSVQRLVFAVCFLRAALFGFCACGVVLSCGSAGWLIQGLMMGSDLFSIPLLYVFWLRHIDGSIRNLDRDLFACAGVTVVIGLLEYFLAVPFLARIVTL